MKNFCVIFTFFSLFFVISCSHLVDDEGMIVGDSCSVEGEEICSASGYEILVCINESWQTKKSCNLNFGEYCRETASGELSCNGKESSLDTDDTSDSDISDTDNPSSDNDIADSDISDTDNQDTGDTNEPDKDSDDIETSDIDISDNDHNDQDYPEEPENDTTDVDNDETDDYDTTEPDENNDSSDNDITDNDTTDNDNDETDDYDTMEPDENNDSSDNDITDNDTTDNDNDEINDYDTVEPDENNDSSDNDITDNDTTDADNDEIDDSDTELLSDEDADTDSGESGEVPECSSSSLTTPCKAVGLIWSSRSDTKKNWNTANSECEHLSEGGFTSGWRLPTINELRKIITNCSLTEPEGACHVTNSCTAGMGSTCYIANNCYYISDTCPNYYGHSLLGEAEKLWSGTSVSDSASQSYAWWVDFSFGAIFFADKNTSNDFDIYYRCVHSID